MDHDYVVFTYVFSRVIRFICFLDLFPGMVIFLPRNCDESFLDVLEKNFWFLESSTNRD